LQHHPRSGTLDKLSPRVRSSSRGRRAPWSAREVNSHVVYPFRDVLALRTFVFLRSREVLLRVRKAVRSLRELGETEHLSSYSLIAIGRGVVWRVSPAEAVAPTGQPNNLLIAQMVDILAAFQGMRGKRVVPCMCQSPECA
jgi:hypothetical protein